MTKKVWIPILATAVLLGVLLIPWQFSRYDDGGSTVHKALIYQVVNWKRPGLTGTKVYLFPHSLKSLDRLWEMESPMTEHQFTARVLEYTGSWVLVEPLEGEPERNSCAQISFGTGALELLDLAVNAVVEIIYDGQIMETYPAQIHPIRWKMVADGTYQDTWLEEPGITDCPENTFQDVVITELYADCFLAEPYFPSPYRIKVNTSQTISDVWCVGDHVSCTYKNARWNEEQMRMEADLVTIAESTLVMEEGKDYKPVIYLYPPEKMPVTVLLKPDGRLTCTYPAYDEGWNVTAEPDGTLTDAQGQTYNYLYWEGTTRARYDLSQGFCVRGADTAAFLEEALAKLGLNRREANEFIVYWLPQMQDNPYNIISFQTDRYTQAAKLSTVPEADTVIRVYMAWQSSEQPVDLPEQVLSAPERKGFTVVEWGGTQVKK